MGKNAGRQILFMNLVHFGNKQMKPLFADKIHEDHRLECKQKKKKKQKKKL